MGKKYRARAQATRWAADIRIGPLEISVGVHTRILHESSGETADGRHAAGWAIACSPPSAPRFEPSAKYRAADQRREECRSAPYRRRVKTLPGCGGSAATAVRGS